MDQKKKNLDKKERDAGKEREGGERKLQGCATGASALFMINRMVQKRTILKNTREVPSFCYFKCHAISDHQTDITCGVKL